MKSKIFFFSLICLFFSFLFNPSLALGQGNFSDAGAMAGATALRSGVPLTTTQAYTAKIINSALVLVGILFLLLMIYGGYIWMIARGDQSEADRAKKIITGAVIGLVIVILAYSISIFVVTKLYSQTTISSS